VADWVTISALATAGGTLVLAGATYASVRSANRAARAAESSLLAQLRPLIVESFEADPPQRINFSDVSGIVIPGGGAAVEVIDERVYVALSLRNVGSGIGVLHGGILQPERPLAGVEHEPVESFPPLRRDLYIPPGKLGFWQVAFRDPDDERYRAVRDAVERGSFSAEILYGDFEGGQRVITRYRIEREDEGWQLSTIRHWQVDRSDPR
jgi:hypothetical protein